MIVTGFRRFLKYSICEGGLRHCRVTHRFYFWVYQTVLHILPRRLRMFYQNTLLGCQGLESLFMSEILPRLHSWILYHLTCKISCLVQMGYGLLWGLWVWRRRTNLRPCRPPMSNPSTSPRTARPDGSGRWNNRMAAQHLLRNLARPSSGQKKNSLKRQKKMPRCTAKRRFYFVLNSGLASHFVCSNSIFHFPSPKELLFAIWRRTKQFLSSYPSSWWSHSCRVHSENSRNKGDTLSAKVFLTSLSTRAWHFIR